MCCWLLTEVTTSSISHTWILLNLLVSTLRQSIATFLVCTLTVLGTQRGVRWLGGSELSVLAALSPEQQLSFTMGQVEQTPSVLQLWDLKERPRQLFHIQNVH